MGVMKLKQTEKAECRLLDAWNVHAFARRDRKDKMQQSRMKMLMGSVEWADSAAADAPGRWW